MSDSVSASAPSRWCHPPRDATRTRRSARAIRPLTASATDLCSASIDGSPAPGRVSIAAATAAAAASSSIPPSPPPPPPVVLVRRRRTLELPPSPSPRARGDARGVRGPSGADQVAARARLDPGRRAVFLLQTKRLASRRRSPRVRMFRPAVHFVWIHPSRAIDRAAREMNRASCSSGKESSGESYPDPAPAPLARRPPRRTTSGVSSVARRGYHRCPTFLSPAPPLPDPPRHPPGFRRRQPRRALRASHPAERRRRRDVQTQRPADVSSRRARSGAGKVPGRVDVAGG